MKVLKSLLLLLIILAIGAEAWYIHWRRSTADPISRLEALQTASPAETLDMLAEHLAEASAGSGAAGTLAAATATATTTDLAAAAARRAGHGDRPFRPHTRNIDAADNQLTREELENANYAFEQQKTDLEFNVLVLGLDYSPGGERTHRCDSVHIFTLKPKLGLMRILSVPRGSLLLTGRNKSQYLANTYFRGRDFVIQELETYFGLRIDYWVETDFARFLGLSRVFKMDGRRALKVLRQRKGFTTGDNQRSHNQAVFLKRMILQWLEFLNSPQGAPMLLAAHNVVRTNLDLPTLTLLASAYSQAGLAQRPENIVLDVQPRAYRSLLHTDYDLARNVFVTPKGDQATADAFDTPRQSFYFGEDAPGGLYYVGKLEKLVKRAQGTKSAERRLFLLEEAVRKGEWYYVDDLAKAARVQWIVTRALADEYRRQGRAEDARALCQRYVQEHEPLEDAVAYVEMARRY